jgi:transcriptional regulator
MEKEKENAIMELRKPYSEIEQQLHVSSQDISQKKYEEEQNKVQISKASQALKLFEQGNSPIQVPVELDMELGEVDRICKEYSESNGLYDFNQVYTEIKKNGSISLFVNKT